MKGSRGLLKGPRELEIHTNRGVRSNPIEAGIQRMIMQGGPVETAFTVYSDFENYVSGIYWDPLGVQLYRISIGGSSWGSRSRSWGARRGFKCERTHLSPFGSPKVPPSDAFWVVQEVKGWFFHL